MIAGSGWADARASPQRTEIAKICFSPSESRSVKSACPRLVVQRDRERRRIDVDPLDHRLLAQQVPKRLGDQVGEPVDLALGCPHARNSCITVRVLPAIRVMRCRSSWANSSLRLSLADRLQPGPPAFPVRLALGDRPVELLRLLIERGLSRSVVDSKSRQETR